MSRMSLVVVRLNGGSFSQLGVADAQDGGDYRQLGFRVSVSISIAALEVETVVETTVATRKVMCSGEQLRVQRYLCGD